MLSELFFTEINKVASDELLLQVFIFYLLRTTLRFPVTQNRIDRSFESEKQSLYFRFVGLFLRHKKCGYLILRFIESTVWLLKQECCIELDDNKFHEAITYFDDLLAKNLPFDTEEKGGVADYFKLSTYITNEQTFDDEYASVFLQTRVGNREGQNIWGPFYWAFIHRFAYRLESKLLTLSDCSQLQKKHLKTCFTTFNWLFNEANELLPCCICSDHYKREEFGKHFSAAIMRKYPYELFKDEFSKEERLCCLKTFTLRLLSQHLFILHHEHTHSVFRQILNVNGPKHDSYTYERFMSEISSAPDKEPPSFIE